MTIKEQVTFEDILICPLCKKELVNITGALCCEQCGEKYEINKGVPLFLKSEEIMKAAVAEHTKKKGKAAGVKKLFRFLKPPHHSVYMDTLESSNNEGQTLIKFLNEFGEGQRIVNIGSLSRKISSGNAEILNLDISYYPNIDIVADAHKLPFKDESLDGVVIKNVFEHLRNPACVRDELKRVLKKGGRVYAKVPFMQPFHAVPDDYQRYSINGLYEFFKDFKVLEEGIAVGPSSALAWFLREYLAILFSFNSEKAYRVWRSFFSYFTAPIKYFDAFFRKRKQAHRLASAFYLVLEK